MEYCTECRAAIPFRNGPATLRVNQGTYVCMPCVKTHGLSTLSRSELNEMYGPNLS